MQRMNAWLRRVPEWAVWAAAALPLSLLVYDTLTGRLGVDPIRDIEHRLGRTALYFLIGSLAITPLRRVFRLNAIHLRRALGLVAFSYAALHLAAWVVFDMGLLWSQMLKDVVKRPYLVFGMTAFVILILLAATSNRYSIRRLGRRWGKLHKLVYAAAILACLHWLWALKLWDAWPLFCAGMILGLLLVRLGFWVARQSKISIKSAS